LRSPRDDKFRTLEHFGSTKVARCTRKGQLRGRQNCSTENKAVIIFLWRMAQQAEVQEEFEVVEEIPDQSYASFLNSKRWKEIRELVLRRCNRTCEACGHREAIIAHHTPYAFGKVPPLWTLKGICRSCHARFTRRFAGGDHRARRDDWLGTNGRSY
jgi:5-methylcytosine-specific restriction endonuclease McrA